ncbi:hypothetical protein Y032_0018g3512 [Ancylostoma ceylanicum]|uniref:Uncharacterized protein n=1 Tax=Ancylostoma ceylanicum TaxID=53326 RepID=A0A016V4U3_9BILA|nr:hypothetical protein Y032_0018g3512 [Ancylostoma ceylanicum]
MFGSDPVGTGRCTILNRLDGMSDFGRENRRDDKSILPEMAWREVDKAVEEVRVEVVDDLLHYPSAKSRQVLRMLLPASAASTNSAARLSLRSSFIASLHRLARTYAVSCLQLSLLHAGVSV